MEIKELHLGHFGKFHHKKIPFQPGINIIYGSNEAGKSTIHSFIRGMLFGIEKKRGRESKDDLYTKYQPWETPGAYQGSMELSVGGKKLLFVRSFLAKERSFCITDLETGREIPFPDAALETLLPFNISTYRNTISIEQLKPYTEKGFAGELQNYIANLSTTRTDEIDIASALQLLKEKKRSLAQTDYKLLLQAQDTLLSELSEKCARCESLSAEFSVVKKEQQKLAEQIQNAKNNIPDTSNLESEIQTLNMLQNRRESIIQTQIKQNRQAEQEQLARAKQQKFYSLLPILIGGIVSFLMALFSNPTGLGIGAGILLIGVIWYFVTSNRLEKEQRQLQTKEFSKNNEVQELLEQQQQILKKYGVQHSEELMKKLSELLSSNRHKELAAAEYLRQYESISQRANHIEWTLEELGDVQLQYEEAEKKKQDLEQLSLENAKELAAVELAMDTIRSLSIEIHDSFGRRLNQSISEKVAALTDGVYNDVVIDEQLFVKVRSGQEYFSLDRLSIGTNHQIYLAVRLAISELFFPEEPVPLIFDDAFALYDDHRLAKTLSYLYNFSNEKRQVFIFTCHKREQQVIEQLHIPYGIISLDIIPAPVRA